jgi:hypothetical protein
MSDAIEVARYELKRALEELVGQANRRLKEIDSGKELHDKNFKMKVHTHYMFKACSDTKEKYDQLVAILWAHEFDKKDK